MELVSIDEKEVVEPSIRKRVVEVVLFLMGHALVVF